MVSRFIETRYRDWVFGSDSEVSLEDNKKFIIFFNRTVNENTAPLEGRSAVSKVDIKGMGSLVIKHYCRGGFMKYLLKDRYFKTGPPRSRQEFEILVTAAGYGINVPEPVLYFHKGELLYRCWLVMRNIPNKGTIADISLNNIRSVRKLMDKVLVQVRRMINKNIFHVDFHPGNVIAGNDDKVYVVDFDKAFITGMDKRKLARKYAGRWERAVIKHNLPEVLSEKLKAGFLT